AWVFLRKTRTGELSSLFDSAFQSSRVHSARTPNFSTNSMRREAGRVLPSSAARCRKASTSGSSPLNTPSRTKQGNAVSQEIIGSCRCSARELTDIVISVRAIHLDARSSLFPFVFQRRDECRGQGLSIC